MWSSKEKDINEGVFNGIRNMPAYKKKIIKWMIVIIVSALIGGICGWRIHAFLNREEPVDTNYITAKLEDASELTTQTITYTSRVPMTDGSIPFITKKSFVMYYNATLRAGVDLSDIDVNDNYKNKVIVKLHHATVLGNPDIDPESIEFLDEKKALLNWNKKEDVTDALNKAREDLENNPSIDMDLLLQKADEHAEELVHMLLDDACNGREVVVKFKN